ncbi:hypothetical protein [Occultella kanbiaonis]|uniref:hypothetical protein n=1 Tax=Occultella kanbiaonis TaxID=2675754 RepID=UPI0012B7230E|nr:hypothetical protein [Occultella kanbiaonis]
MSEPTQASEFEDALQRLVAAADPSDAVPPGTFVDFEPGEFCADPSSSPDDPPA